MLILNINLKRDENIIHIDTSHASGELNLLEKFYFDVLSYILNGTNIKIVTISPQKYSFGYDRSPFYSKTVNSQKLLINDITAVDREFLAALVRSAEFRRTLLFVVRGLADLSDSELYDVTLLPKNYKNNKVSFETIFCEDDGDSLFIYNIDVTVAELESIAKKSTDNIFITEQ